MSWSNEPPPRFTLHYEWPSGGTADEPARRALIAETLDDAKLEAAILYACADMPEPPTAYRIVKGARRVVYRYPEVRAA